MGKKRFFKPLNFLSPSNTVYTETDRMTNATDVNSDENGSSHPNQNKLQIFNMSANMVQNTSGRNSMDQEN